MTTKGAKTQVASKGRPSANSAACARAPAFSSTAGQPPSAGSEPRQDPLASSHASDRAPGNDVADRLARLQTLDQQRHASGMAAALSRRAAAIEPRSHDESARAIAFRKSPSAVCRR